MKQIITGAKGIGKMTIPEMKTALMDGAKLFFAKQYTENEEVRGLWGVTFDRRKGFHVVEKKLKQVRSIIEREGGAYLLKIKDDHLIGVTQYGQELVTELPDDEAEAQEIYQKLPRYDFTQQVQSQKFLKKLGFF